MVYIYFIKKCKFKIFLVKKKQCSFVFEKVEYGNKNCLWFSFTKLVMYLVHRVFLLLRYACGFTMGTCIYIFFAWVFMNILSVSIFIGENFSLCFLALILIFDYYAIRLFVPLLSSLIYVLVRPVMVHVVSLE